MLTSLILAILASLVQPVAAELTVNEVFGDGMVLQRDTTIPVWGTAEPNERIVVTIDFDHVGGGLAARNNNHRHLEEFAIAGADRRFVWAEAVIEGDRVVVWSDEVQQPVAVRYGSADNPEEANLYNLEGLPASPFRTDAW